MSYIFWRLLVDRNYTCAKPNSKGRRGTFRRAFTCSAIFWDVDPAKRRNRASEWSINRLEGFTRSQVPYDYKARVVWKKTVKSDEGRQTNSLPPLSSIERSASNLTELTLSRCPSRVMLENSSCKSLLGKTWRFDGRHTVVSGIFYFDRLSEILYFDRPRVREWDLYFYRQLWAVPRSPPLIVLIKIGVIAICSISLQGHRNGMETICTTTTIIERWW